MEAIKAKAAWVTPRLGRNGNLLYMGPLLKGISRAYAKFHVFTVEFGGDCSKAGFDITCAGSIKLVNQDVTRDGVPTAIPVISPDIVKKLYRFRPDLLILNEFSLLTIYCMLLSLILRRSKVLLIVENRPIITASWLTRGLRKFLRRLIARNADAILTNNISGKSYLIDELGINESKIVCRPYLISDMSHINTANGDFNPKHPGNEKPIHFLYVGRLIQSKGLHYALEAFGDLKKKHPGRFIFEIVGDGPYRPFLEKQIRQTGLEEYVRFHGQQPYSKLAEFYRESDVFLFPTLMDYRSLVCFEALSVGLPILVSIHDGGSVETVKEDENGYTFDPRDYRYLCKLMARFIEEPERIRKFSAKSREMSASYTLPRAIESVVIASNVALAAS